jgi:N-acetyldiaminopimelate deacetylase
MAITPYELRHILHKNPELSFEEFETTKLLINALRELDKDLKLKIYTPYKTGLLVEYAPDAKNDFLLYRADIDALPIKEENEIDFKSCNNFMHACGHDVHTSILYNFISLVLKERINKNILFLFQPAEESGGGAIEFFNTGIFNKFNIKNAFALHVTDEYSEGTIACSKGVLFSSTLEVDIDFIGVSSHVAFPFNGKNAFDALRLFLESAEKIPKDFTEPFIFGVGKINAGEVRNINPGNAHLEGTIRGLSMKKTELFFEKLLTISQGIEKATDVKIKLNKGAVYPEVIVNDELYDKLFPVLSKKINFIDCGYKMTGEDFGFFSQKYPSFMFWLGTSKGENHGLHNPKFLPDDKVIDIGADIFMSILGTL